MDFLVIALGAIFGANLRYRLSRLAAVALARCKMRDAMTVEVIMYFSQADGRHRWPLHSELARQRMRTSHLVDAGRKLPVTLIFLVANGHANRFVPILKETAPHRLMVRAKVGLEQGTVD